MSKVTVADVRQILENDFPWATLPKTDEKLLKMDLIYDFEFDSMDVAELSDVIQEKYGVSVNYLNEKTEKFRRDSTIENYIEMFE